MKTEQKLQAAFSKRKAKEEVKTKEIKAVTEIDLLPFEDRFGKDQLATWKKQYGDRDLIYLGVEDTLAVLRPPTADDLGDYLTAMGTNGMSKAVAMIIEQLWIDGDYKLIEDEDYFIAVFLQMNNILESKKADFFRA